MRHSEHPRSLTPINTLVSAALVLGIAASSPASIAAATDTPPVSFVMPTHVAEVVPQVVVAQPTVEALISSIAADYKIPSTTLYNVAWSESKLDPDPAGHNDGGLACGVVQIHADLWHMDCDDLKAHPELGLKFLAKHIKAGDAWKYWTSLNCYTYVNTKFHFDLPKMAQIVPNSDPVVGAVAIFLYSDGTKHIAYVTAVSNGSFTVSEANFKAGLIGTRKVQLNDPFLQGFWTMG